MQTRHDGLEAVLRGVRASRRAGVKQCEATVVAVMGFGDGAIVMAAWYEGRDVIETCRICRERADCGGRRSRGFPVACIAAINGGMGGHIIREGPFRRAARAYGRCACANGSIHIQAGLRGGRAHSEISIDGGGA